MKSLFSLVAATFAFGFVFSANLVAGEKETEKMLIKVGWVRLSVEELKTLKNYTATGLMGWAWYVDPTGTNYVYQHYNGKQNRGKRKITTAGRACYEGLTLIKRTPGQPGADSSWACGSVWKRGSEYLDLKSDGTYFSEYEIKPGNTENL